MKERDIHAAAKEVAQKLRSAHPERMYGEIGKIATDVSAREFTTFLLLLAQEMKESQVSEEHRYTDDHDCS